MIALTFGGLRADPPSLNDAIEVVANLEADVRLESEGEIIYEEVSFPVAELAIALTQWLQVHSDGGGDFEFDSMSAEEPGLLWIRRTGGGWRVGSTQQERPETRIFTSAEVEELVREYIRQLAECVENVFGLRVSTLFTRALRTAASGPTSDPHMQG